MTRHRPAIREHHRPGDVGFAPKQLAIDKIRDAAEEEADRDCLGDDVGECQDRQPAGSREQQDRERHPQRAAVKRHPAMPQIKRFDGVLQVITGLVKQHIADPAAKHDTERRPNQEVIDIAALHETRRPVRQDQAIAPAKQEPDDVGQGIPPDNERADGDCDRIDRWERYCEERHRRY